MTTRTAAASAIDLRLVPIACAALIGLGIIALAGHVQADALHAAAHDTRHATGFPCH